MKQKDIGYIAGIIDGEGCFCIEKRYTGGKLSGFRLQLVITNTNKFVLEYIQKYIGFGTIHERKNYNKKKHKMSYSLEINSNGLRYLLPMIMNILIVKRKQCEIFIQILQTLGRTGYSKDKMKEKMRNNYKLGLQITELNKRGP